MAEIFFDLNTLALRVDQDRTRGRRIVFANTVPLGNTQRTRLLCV